MSKSPNGSLETVLDDSTDPTVQREGPPVETAPGRNDGNVSLDDIPLKRFHIKMAALTFGAHFNDGFEIGAIGIAIVIIGQTHAMELDAWWKGALGAGALFGLFFGSLIFGAVSDKVGRRRIFTLSFLVIALATFSEWFVAEPWQLLALRIIIGLGLGGDYAVGHAMLAEILPRKRRGEILGSFSVIWTFGYVFATVLGIILMRSNIHDSWRWMLIAPGFVAVFILIARLGIPESPRWLVRQGRTDEAQAIVKRLFGDNVTIDREDIHQPHGSFRDLFNRQYIRRTAFNSLFFACLVMPYFAIYTFLPDILKTMGLSDLTEQGGGFAVEIYLNLFLLAGAVAGIWLTYRLSRRGFAIYAFVVLTISLLALALVPMSLPVVAVALFATFTFTLSAVCNLVGVFPAESFPTAVRSSGIGFATAISRIGSVVSTFLLPVSLHTLGLGWTMGLLSATLAIGLAVTIAWAPETKDKVLSSAAPSH